MSRTGHFNARRPFAVAICFCAVLIIADERASATVISNYGFSGNPASTAVDAAVADATFSAFTRTNLIDDSHPNDFQTVGFTTAGTLDATQFEGFTVTASGASSLTFEGLSWDTNRSGQGPSSGAVRYLIDGILAASFLYSIPTANTPGHAWDFADFVLSPGHSVEFRFFGYDASDSGNPFLRLDNVALIDAKGPRPPAVPEPTSLLLAGTGMLIGLGGRYVARRKSPPIA